MSLFFLPFVAGMLAVPEGSGGFVRGVTMDQQSGAVVIEVFVDPDGIVVDCAVRYSSMPPRHTEQVCERAIGRDAGEGAVGPNGDAAYGSVVVSRIMNGSPSLSELSELLDRPAEIELLVAQMPANQERLTVDLLVYVDETGRVVQCDLQSAEHADFAYAACEQSYSFAFPVRTGSDGLPVPYVRSLEVAFLPDEAGS